MARSRAGRDADWGEQALVFAMGAAGGLAIGLLLSRQPGPPERVRQVGSRIRQRARDVALTLRPGRLRRAAREQLELTRLEDAVLDEFLRDRVLSERAIDVGCISRGIIELSGLVRTPAEAEHAVAAARRVGGVETVVSRMDVEDELRRRRRLDPESGEKRMSGEWTGRNIGMGSRRQGGGTDPETTDDSHHQLDHALGDADHAQMQDEGISHQHPVMGARPGRDVPEVDFSEDELDNQSPYGQHAVPVPEQPQAMNSASRVGEGLNPGTELALEAADVPVKPHGDRPRAGRGGETS